MFFAGDVQVVILAGLQVVILSLSNFVSFGKSLSLCAFLACAFFLSCLF